MLLPITGRRLLRPIRDAARSLPRGHPRGAAPQDEVKWDTRSPMSGLLTSLRTPRGLVTILILLILAVLPLLTQAFDQRYLLSIGTRIVIWAIAAISLNMILGYGGLVSFGHAVFFGIGGYAVGILSHHGVQSGSVQWRVGIVAAALWAALIGALSLRTRGLYFIMITL